MGRKRGEMSIAEEEREKEIVEEENREERRGRETALEGKEKGETPKEEKRGENTTREGRKRWNGTGRIYWHTCKSFTSLDTLPPANKSHAVALHRPHAITSTLST